MKKEVRNKNRKWDVFKEYVNIHKKQYLIVACLFIIGVVIGIIIFTYTNEQGYEQVNTSITTTVKNLKEGYEINYSELTKRVIINHSLTTLLLWFLGCSVIEIPMMYLVIVFKGFSLGYTISSIILIYGNLKGILFAFSTLLLQNLLIIPAVISIGVSSINLYSSIMKNKRIENIKIEIIRHTFLSFIMWIILIIGAIIEVFISTNILKLIINFNLI